MDSKMVWFQLLPYSWYVSGEVVGVDLYMGTITVKDVVGTIRTIGFHLVYDVNFWRKGFEITHFNAYGMTKICHIHESRLIVEDMESWNDIIFRVVRLFLCIDII